MANTLFRGKRKFKKLNDFQDYANQNGYEVITSRTKDKQNRKRGKVLEFSETVKSFHEGIQDDADRGGCNEATGTECEIEILTEDTPDYCMFGKTCVHDAVKKLILKNATLEDNQDERDFEKLAKEENEEEIF